MFYLTSNFITSKQTLTNSANIIIKLGYNYNFSQQIMPKDEVATAIDSVCNLLATSASTTLVERVGFLAAFCIASFSTSLTFFLISSLECVCGPLNNNKHRLGQVRLWARGPSARGQAGQGAERCSHIRDYFSQEATFLK